MSLVVAAAPLAVRTYSVERHPAVYEYRPTVQVRKSYEVVPRTEVRRTYEVRPRYDLRRSVEVRQVAPATTVYRPSYHLL